MPRLSSVNQLQELGNVLSDAVDQKVPRLVIPAGTCGQASGANDLTSLGVMTIPPQ